MRICLSFFTGVGNSVCRQAISRSLLAFTASSVCYYCTGKCIRKVTAADKYRNLADGHDKREPQVYNLCLADKTLIVPTCRGSMWCYELETVESDRQGCDY